MARLRTTIIMETTITATDGVTPPLLTLLTWFSPAFPVGAFAYSHGLEAAVAEGRVTNADEVESWIGSLVLSGSGWNDLVLLAQALRVADREAELAELSDLSLALSGSAERRGETQALGSAFARASAPWSQEHFHPEEGERPYPIAVALAAAKAGLPAREVLLAYAHGFSANLVSAAVRLVPLGQAEAVSILKRLEPVVLRAARRAETSTTDDLGSRTLLSDIAAMRHETLHTRLFRS